MKALVIFTLFLICGATQALDLAASGEVQPVSLVSARVSPLEVQPGARIAVSIDLSIAENFSVYEDKLKIFPLEPDGMTLGGLQMSPVVEFIDFSGKQHRGLQKTAKLDFLQRYQKMQMFLSKRLPWIWNTSHAPQNTARRPQNSKSNSPSIFNRERSNQTPR